MTQPLDADTSDAAVESTEPTGEAGFTTPEADRPPTPEEERAAERAADGVDLESVAEHYEEAAKTGADVRGEGQIEPG